MNSTGALNSDDLKTSEFVHWDLFKISLKDNVGLSDFLKDSEENYFGFSYFHLYLAFEKKMLGKNMF